jgi:hypothetical protein
MLLGGAKFMGMHDTWPDPSVRMKNPDDPETAPGSAATPISMPSDPAEDRARKAVRARALTDPLGAKGQRDSRRRIAREGRACRLATIGAAVSFAGSLGFITWNAQLIGNGGGSVESPDVALAESNNSSMTVIDPTNTPSATATIADRPVTLNAVNRASDDEHDDDDDHDSDHDDHEDDDHSSDSGTLPATSAPSSSSSSITASSSTTTGSSAPTPVPSTSHVKSHSS